MLAARYQTIVAEDLNVAGMTRNRCLARAIADQGFAKVRQMLGYKTIWNGGMLMLADHWRLRDRSSPSSLMPQR